MSEIKDAAVKRAAALSERDAEYVDALKVERNGYVVRGNADRVAQVDVELARYGVKIESKSAAKPAE